MTSPSNHMTSSPSVSEAERPDVYELRQYTLRPGRRDVLVELFDREFVETQEAVGARVLGQFRDLDDPDRFVWVRAFADMDGRRRALEAFYGGPVWAAHREAANATMLDSDDVLLLRPAWDGSGFTTAGSSRPPAGTGEEPGTLVSATVYPLAGPATDGFADFFAHEVAPVMTDTSAPPVASFVTESSSNTFPALPVREGEHVFVWFASFTSEDHHLRHLEQLQQSTAWTARVSGEIADRLAAPPQRLRLSPTARSLLR